MSNHFYKSIIAANEYDGPAVVSVYTTCQPEHGVGDNMAMQQSKLAVDTRTFPVLIYDPRKGGKIAQRQKWSAGFIPLQLPQHTAPL